MSARIVTGLAIALTPAWLAAQGDTMRPFQYEVTGGWAMTSIDTSPDIDIDQFRATGTYHLKPVALASGPWNEAAFLEHSTEISVLAEYQTFDIGSFSADGFVAGAGFRYAEKDKPIAAEFAFSVGSLDGDSGIDIDVSTIEARVGYWLRPNAILGVDFSRQKTDGASLLDVEELRFGVFGKIVHDLGEGRAINGEACIGIDSIDDSVSTDQNVEFQGSVDFYFTPRYSAGALIGLSSGDADSQEGTTLGVRGSAWVSPQLAVDAEYQTFQASNNTGNDSDTFLIELTLRF